MCRGKRWGCSACEREALGGQLWEGLSGEREREASISGIAPRVRSKGRPEVRPDMRQKGSDLDEIAPCERPWPPTPALLATLAAAVAALGGPPRPWPWEVRWLLRPPHLWRRAHAEPCEAIPGAAFASYAPGAPLLVRAEPRRHRLKGGPPPHQRLARASADGAPTLRKRMPPGDPLAETENAAVLGPALRPGRVPGWAPERLWVRDSGVAYAGPPLRLPLHPLCA